MGFTMLQKRQSVLGADRSLQRPEQLGCNFRLFAWLDGLMVVVAVGVLTSGCRPELVATVTSFPAIPETVLSTVFSYFVGRLGLQFSSKNLKKGAVQKTPEEQMVDRHVGFFIKWRTAFLGKANPDWLTESDYAILKTRVASEVVAVKTYVVALLGTASTPGRLGGAAEPGDLGPGDKSKALVVSDALHINLADVAFTHTYTTDDAASRTKQVYIDRRRRAVLDICWRAAALHPELWSDSTSETGTLNESMINEVVDRRLRTVERMHTQVGDPTKLGGGRRITAAKLSGVQRKNWFDRFRVRPFEYPRVPVDPVMRAAIGPDNILPANGNRFESGKALIREFYPG